MGTNNIVSLMEALTKLICHFSSFYYSFASLSLSTYSAPPSSSSSPSGNLILECLVGLFIVFVSLLAFISLVWLKDQLTTGAGPEWLAADHQEAQRQAEPPQNNRTDEERQKLISQAHIDMRRRQRTTERVK